MKLRKSLKWWKKLWRIRKFATWAAIFVALTATTPSCNSSDKQDDLLKHKTHVVKKWETFWSLWEQSDKSMTFEDFLAEFINLNKNHDGITDNGIEDDIIKIGETYFMPTETKGDSDKKEEEIIDEENKKEDKEEVVINDEEKDENWWQEIIPTTKERVKSGVVEYIVDHDVEYLILKWNKMSQINKQLDKFSRDEDLQYVSKSKLRNNTTKEYKNLKKNIDAWYDIYISLPLKNEPISYKKWKKNFKSLEDIIEPEIILSNKLNDHCFIIDPGHGNIDPWTLWYRDRGWDKKEKVAVYEAPAVMDISYRVAKLLKAHGADVELTHYTPTREVLDQKDLPPNGRTFLDLDGDGKADEGFYDLYNGEDKPKKPILDKRKRGREKEKYATKLTKKLPGKKKYGISFHADHVKDSSSYVYKFRIDVANTAKDNTYVKNIQKNLQWKKWFGNEWIATQSLYIGRAFNAWWASWFLLELTPITNKSGAYIMASPKLRQKLAEQIVEAHLKVYGK